MMKLLIVIACLIAVACAAPLSQEQYQFLFTKFVQQYGKRYETNDFFTKYNQFRSNLDLIVSHNADPKQTYTMGVNEFTDYSAQEFSQMMGLRTELAQPYALSQLQAPTNGLRTPEKFANKSWVSEMNPPKNQASCGSCWAFSTVATLEFEAKQATGKLHDLSEQQLVDCAGSFGNNGCNGGLMSNAMEYVLSNKGLCDEKSYPYKAKVSTCQTTCKPVVKASGYHSVAATEAAHYEMAQKRVVAVALAASSSAFQFYKSGVVTNCTDKSVNHAVALVGTGNLNGQNYFLVRNSWGNSWGESGLIKLGQGNQCGLTTSKFDIYATV